MGYIVKGTLKKKIGKYICQVNFTIVGLTDSTKEEFNKMKAQEGNKMDESKTTFADVEEMIQEMERTKENYAEMEKGYKEMAKGFKEMREGYEAMRRFLA